MQDRELRDLARKLKSLEDGKKLRRILAARLRSAIKPVVPQVKSSIKSMASHSFGKGPSLRSAVARRVSAQARVSSGRTAGAKIVARQIKLRGFENAPRRLNRKSFKHPLFGDTEQWIVQVGKPGWFDEPIRRNRPTFKKGVVDTLKDFRKELNQ